VLLYLAYSWKLSFDCDWSLHRYHS